MLSFQRVFYLTTTTSKGVAELLYAIFSLQRRHLLKMVRNFMIDMRRYDDDESWKLRVLANCALVSNYSFERVDCIINHFQIVSLFKT